MGPYQSGKPPGWSSCEVTVALGQGSCFTSQVLCKYPTATQDQLVKVLSDTVSCLGLRVLQEGAQIAAVLEEKAMLLLLVLFCTPNHSSRPRKERQQQSNELYLRSTVCIFKIHKPPAHAYVHMRIYITCTRTHAGVYRPRASKHQILSLSGTWRFRAIITQCAPISPLLWL